MKKNGRKWKKNVLEKEEFIKHKQDAKIIQNKTQK